MIARGLMTIEKKRKLEKEEEDESSDDYDVWSGVVNQAELDRFDGIVSEHLAVFEVSEFLLGRYIDDDGLNRDKQLQEHRSSNAGESRAIVPVCDI